jgi:predicted transcriptional regulator
MRPEKRAKGDRALELYEKGCSYPIIAERLGISASHVGDMLRLARKRKTRDVEKVQSEKGRSR